MVFLTSMDDIQTLIYFGLIIIWFLSRVFAKKKQKKPQNTTPPPQRAQPEAPRQARRAPEPAVTFEDILRELTGTTVTEVPQPESRYPDLPEITEEEPEEESLMPEEAPEPSYGHPDIIVREGAFKEFIVKEKKGSLAARKVFKLLKSPQGLKQAVILKEILDRPYQ